MASNFYFSNFSNSMEQRLIEDLIIESIRIFGLDMYYMPRKMGTLDDLLNEDDTPIFDQAFLLEMYVKNVEGFEGEGDFLSKFGLQIRDSMTLTISMRKFAEEIGTYNEAVRPKEGDLIFFPLNRKIFEIKFVEHESIFYQMGALQTYDLRVELFEYSNEVFKTGIPEIDSLLAKYNTANNSITGTVDENTIEGIELIDPLADNLTIEQEADGFLDFSEENPFGETNY